MLDLVDRLFCELGGLLERQVLLEGLVLEGVLVLAGVGPLLLPLRHVVVDVVHDLVVVVDVRDDADLELFLVGVHVGADVLHRERDRMLDLVEVLDLLYLVVRELVLSGD